MRSSLRHLELWKAQNMTPPQPCCRLTLDGLLQPFTSQPLHQPFGPSRIALHSSVKRTVWKSVLTYFGAFKSLFCFYNNSQLSYSLGSWEVPSSRGVHDGAYHICLGSIAAILAVLTCLAEVVLLQIVCFFPHPFQVSRLYRWKACITGYKTAVKHSGLYERKQKITHFFIKLYISVQNAKSEQLFTIIDWKWKV